MQNTGKNWQSFWPKWSHPKQSQKQIKFWTVS